MFGRRSSPADAADVESTVEEVDESTGKGRATPKRKEAEAARRKRLAAPRTRKEAAAVRRERVAEARVKQRAALAGTGDDRYLPVRDRGPVKKLVRNYIDSRRTIGEFLIPVFIGMFLLVTLTSGLDRNLSAAIAPFAWVAVLVVLAFDSVRVVRGVKAAVRERFGDDATKGITLYALMRSWQMRRLRLPKAVVRPGDPI